MKRKITRVLSPLRVVVLGYFLIILTGALLLCLPISSRAGTWTPFHDTLFTATSATCVTGLIVYDTYTHWTLFGQIVIISMIQVGGIGFMTLAISALSLTKRKIGLRGRFTMQEDVGASQIGGIVRMTRFILLGTALFEGVGALLSFIVFVQDYPPMDALGIALFHSVAAFNNSGFDVLGGLQNLIPYQNDVLLNLVTAGLIIFGGIGFLVIMEVWRKRSFRKLTLHSKVVITVTGFLIVIGTIGLKLTEDITWLGAFFHSVSARTAGFSTYPLGTFTNAGLFILVILMFIGASPGSTGGGIKTSTIFVIFSAIRRTMKNGHCVAFKRRIEDKTIMQAFIVLIMSLFVVCLGTMLLCVAEPEYSFMQLLFECVSAFGTVGLSTGITSELGVIAKIILILTMFTGRLGVMTIATLGTFKEPGTAVYTSEDISIG